MARREYIFEGLWSQEIITIIVVLFWGEGVDVQVAAFQGELKVSQTADCDICCFRTKVEWCWDQLTVIEKVSGFSRCNAKRFRKIRSDCSVLLSFVCSEAANDTIMPFVTQRPAVCGKQSAKK